MSDTIGKFIKHSDKPPAKIQPHPALTTPAVIPFEPAPKLSHTGSIPFEPAPALSKPSVVPFQPAPPLVAPPIIPLEPHPVLSMTASLPEMHHPDLSVTASIPLEPAPPLGIPAIIPLTPTPELRVTGSLPVMHHPDLGVTASIQLTPTPELSITASIPLTPTPTLREPSIIPITPIGPREQIHSPFNFENVENLTPYDGGPLAPWDKHPGVHPKPPREQIHLTSMYKQGDQLVETFYGDPNDSDPHDHPGRQALPADIGPLITTATPFVFDPHLYTMSTTKPGGANDVPVSDGNPINHSDAVTATEGKNSDFWTETGVLANKSLQALHGNMDVFGVKLGLNGTNGFTSSVSLRDMANNLRNGALNVAATLVQGTINDVTNTIENAIRNPFGLGAANENGKQPTKIVLDDLKVWAQNSVDTYNLDARQNAQKTQQRQADDLFGALSKNNVYNNNNTYSEVFKKNVAEKNTTMKTLQSVFTPSPKRTSIIPAADITAVGMEEINALNASIRAEFVEEEENGSYIPLVFTDMRTVKMGNPRSVRFRPFITNLVETFSPQWSMQNYFGRVDPVATYQSTGRVLQLSFKIVCFSPSDLADNFARLEILTSMCYPEYDKHGVFYAGPITKLRVGDMISSRFGDNVEGIQKGLTGVITSLGLNYGKSIWELAKDSKVPQHIDVTMGFQVLHQAPIGTVGVAKNGKKEYSFGGITTTTTETGATPGAFRAPFGTNTAPNVGVVSPGKMRPPGANRSAGAQAWAGITAAVNFAAGTEQQHIQDTFPTTPNPDGNSLLGK